MIDLVALRDIAIAAAAEAQDIAGNAKIDPAKIESKSRANDLVTEFDRLCEVRIRAALRAHTPYPILGEEGGAQDGEGELRWIVDPIDGTVNFVHGLPHFATVIALERIADHEVLVGVIDATAGLRTRGAVIRGEGSAARVSARATLAESLIATGFPYDSATHAENNFRAFEAVHRRAGAMRRIGCASLDLFMVATGRLDGYWESRLAPWDIAAGALFVTEAGGKVTSTRGGAFDSHTGDVCATNGAIHEELLGVLAATR